MVFGGYRVVEELGKDGVAQVYVAAPEAGFAPSVLLRVVPTSSFVHESARKDFARAAKLYATLSHSAVVQVYDVFEDGENFVVVSEHVEGIMLDDFLERTRALGEPVSDAAALFIGMRIVGALAAAHAVRDPVDLSMSPIVHGAVRPEVVLLPPDGYVRLAEFRAARLAPRLRPRAARPNRHAPPEMVQHGQVSLEGDVYSACLVIWELLARRSAVPVHVTGPELSQALADPVWPKLTAIRPDLPRKLTEAIDKGLVVRRDERKMTTALLLSVVRSSFVPEEGEAWVQRMLALLETGPTLRRESELVTGSLAPHVAPTLAVPSSSPDRTSRVAVVSGRDPIGLLAWGDSDEIASTQAKSSDEPPVANRRRPSSTPPPLPVAARAQGREETRATPDESRRETRVRTAPMAQQGGGLPLIVPSGVPAPVSPVATPASPPFAKPATPAPPITARSTEVRRSTLTFPSPLPPSMPSQQPAPPIPPAPRTPGARTEAATVHAPPPPRPTSSQRLPAAAERDNAPVTQPLPEASARVDGVAEKPSVAAQDEPGALPLAAAAEAGWAAQDVTLGLPQAAPQPLRSRVPEPASSALRSAHEGPAVVDASRVVGAVFGGAAASPAVAGQVQHLPPVRPQVGSAAQLPGSVPPPSWHAQGVGENVFPRTQQHVPRRGSLWPIVGLGALGILLIVAGVGYTFSGRLGLRGSASSGVPASPLRDAAPGAAARDVASSVTDLAASANPTMLPTAVAAQSPSATTQPSGSAAASGTTQPSASGVASATAQPSASGVASATAQPSASAVASGASSSTPAAATPLVADATHAVLHTRDARPGHRIFVDGRVLGETPESVLVRCGVREVKLGSAGYVRRPDFPCGGELSLR